MNSRGRRSIEAGMPLASTDAPRSRLATVLFAGTVVGALDETALLDLSFNLRG